MTATVRSTADLTADPTADMTADLAQARAWHQAGQLDLARQGYLALLARPACAAVMAESALFASFSYLEGLGLAALLDDWVGDGDAAQRRIDAGLATAATYSQARFEQELLAAWRAITGPRWGDYLNRVSR